LLKCSRGENLDESRPGSEYTKLADDPEAARRQWWQ
jgi:hypothetical protein